MKSERPIEISQTYSPADDRTVIIDRIPAIEMTLDDESAIGLEPAVCERVEKLVERALRSSDAPEQHVTYSAIDSIVTGRRWSASRSVRHETTP